MAHAYTWLADCAWEWRSFGIVTYRLNANQKEREFKRKKLEECFRAVHHYILSITTSYLVWIDVMSGKITYDQANDMIMREVSGKIVNIR